MSIEITDEMVVPIADYLYGNNDGWTLIACRNALTAALPLIEQQMRAALEAPIRELHKPVPMVPGLDDTPVCYGCENPGRFVPYPCPTIQALDEKGTRS